MHDGIHQWFICIICWLISTKLCCACLYFPCCAIDFDLPLRSFHVAMQFLLKSNTAYKSLRMRVSHVLMCCYCEKGYFVSNCNFLPLIAHISAISSAIFYYAMCEGGKYLSCSDNFIILHVAKRRLFGAIKIVSCTKHSRISPASPGNANSKMFINNWMEIAAMRNICVCIKSEF